MSSDWAASALRFWSDAGVDVIVGEEPRDWLNPAPRSSPKAATPAEPAPEPLPAELAEFQTWLMTTDRLPGTSPSAPRLGPAGNESAAVMVLTDVPALADFEAGRLVSSDGLFDKMLGAIQLDRDSIYLASLSPLRPASGALTADAARLYAVIARHHIALVAPKVVLLLGDVCSKALLGAEVSRTRTIWHEIETGAGRVRALVTMKPEKLNLSPSLKKHAWADLQMLKEGIEE